MPKTEEERPAGCKYWLASDMVAWLKANTKLEDPEYAAKWWRGCQLAEGYSDMNARGRVEMIVDGLPALTLEDVTEALQEEFEEGYEEIVTVEDHDVNLEQDWRQFWEVGDESTRTVK